jgi:hypothetical protein
MLSGDVGPNRYSLFDGQTKLVDGQNYEVCCFRNCTLVYDGGESPHFSNCSFVSCNWQLGRVMVEGIGFMGLFMVREADELIDSLLYAVRRRPEPLSATPEAAAGKKTPLDQNAFSLHI